MNLVAAREGVGIAVEALRSNKVRAALTILGIVIGVATVMGMAAMITGIRSTLTETVEAAGPNNFSVQRFDVTAIRFSNGGDGRPPWHGKPPITLAEAEMIASLPSVRAASPQLNTSADLRVGPETVAGVQIPAVGIEWPEYMIGDFVSGRNFLRTEVERASPVVVLSSALATSLFGEVDPTGTWVRLRNERFQVIGVYEREANLFTEMAKNWAIVPHTTAIRRLGADADWLDLLVVPEPHVPRAVAMDEVTAALRSARGLRPLEENNFALLGVEEISALFDRLTGVFFLVMLVLSSIGLMVGGVGVVAIMMISVTERTREIGVRKALGATRREIMWQFLVESTTVTVIGGAIGLLLGGGGAMLLAAATPVPAAVPLWAVVAALGVSAVAGIGFGLYPASRAARMDPVEALRYE